MTREEAIETIRRCCPRVGDSQCDFETALRELIPELRESEDERIRRTLVEYFGPSAQLDFIRGVPIQKIRDWLEKQKEQKPAEWSEEDEDYMKDLMDYFGHNLPLEHTPHAVRDWLKSLRPQSSSQSNTNHTVWHNASEEKPTKLPIIHIWYHGNRVDAVTHEDTCLQAELDDINFQPDDKWAYVEDLLNVQSNWKPSEEQMEALKAAMDRNDSIGYNLRQLYEQLKKPGVKEEPEYYQHFDPDC